MKPTVLTYILPFDVQECRQDNVGARYLHLLSLEDPIELAQLPRRHHGAESVFKFEVLK